MDRATMLAILSAASDDSLASALSAMGIESGAGDVYGEAAEMDKNPVMTWDQLDVTVPANKKQPMWDKSALFQEQAARPTDRIGLPQPGEDEMGMVAMGMV